MATSDMRHAPSDSAWSLGAVLAERAVDERTHLLVIRADVGLPAALALGRRLLGLRLAGYTTLTAGRATVRVGGFPLFGSVVSTVPTRGVGA